MGRAKAVNIVHYASIPVADPDLFIRWGPDKFSVTLGLTYFRAHKGGGEGGGGTAPQARPLDPPLYTMQV